MTSSEALLVSLLPFWSKWDYMWPGLPAQNWGIVMTQLGYRFAHVLRRMLPIAMHLLQRDGQYLNGHELFLKRVGSSFQNFIEFVEKTCLGKCLEDLQSTTRYVTWSLHTKSKTSLKAMLGKVMMASQPGWFLSDLSMSFQIWYQCNFLYLTLCEWRQSGTLYVSSEQNRFQLWLYFI